MSHNRLTITLASAKATFLQYIKATFSINTFNDYQLTLNRFVTHTGDMPLANLTPDHAINFINYMKEVPWNEDDYGNLTHGTSPKYRTPKTLKNIHIALCSFSRWCHTRKYLPFNFMDSIPSPKAPRQPVMPLTTKNIKQLLNACVESRPWKNRPLTRSHRPTAGRDRAIIALLIETGIRATELCNLTIGDVAFERLGGTVHVRHGKGNKSRVVPFSRNCANILQDWLITRPESSPNAPLFVSVVRNFGHPMNRVSLRRLVNRIGEKANVPNVGPHRLRTTAFCMMVQNGMTAFNLKQIAGHSDIQTTMRYVHAARVNLDDAMRHASPLDNIRF